MVEKLNNFYEKFIGFWNYEYMHIINSIFEAKQLFGKFCDSMRFRVTRTLRDPRLRNKYRGWLSKTL